MVAIEDLPQKRIGRDDLVSVGPQFMASARDRVMAPTPEHFGERDVMALRDPGGWLE